MKNDAGPPPDAPVVQQLAALKRRGGVVLVVGPARAAHEAICNRFLERARERVVVLTDGNPDAMCCDDESTTVVDCPVPTRSATRATPASSPDVRSVANDLELAMRTDSSDDELTHVCLDSLLPFVDVTARPTLVSSLESIREAALDSGAIVHVHLPAIPDAIPAELLEPVDVVVEVRQRDTDTYQRWYLTESGPITSWIAV